MQTCVSEAICISPKFDEMMSIAVFVANFFKEVRTGNNVKQNLDDQIEQKENKAISKIEKLKEDLKQAIKEERYEDAAKIRDEIKKQEE